MDIQKAMYTAQLVKQLSDTKGREQRTAKQQFMTKDSFDKYNDMMSRGGFASDQLWLEQLKDANRLPGAERYAIPEKGRAMAIEGQNQPLLPQMEATTPQLAHPERGTEFAGMLSGPSAPSSTFEFGN